ncbi:MAG: hypothetical protein NTV33_13890, partial [Coprothermobacterota bacterium]|nr:hypothetical protein [Coprothermobacterota bacterium]
GQGMGTDYGYYLTRSLMSNTRAGVALNNTRAGSPIQEWGGMVIFNLYGDPTLALNSGGAPYLKLVAPQGGEVWPIGSQQVIGWESSSLAGNVRVDVSRDFGASWQTALASIPNAGSVSWTVTGPVGSLRVRVCSVNSPMLYDASIYDTTIASLQLTSPVGGEIFNKGSDQTISWTSYGINSSGIRIELSRDNGVHWETITPSTGNSGSWPWPVQGEDSAACRIRLTCLDYPILQSASPSPFSINGLTVLNPSGWENLMIGGSHVIQWRSTGVSGNVKIELNREYPGGPWETLFSDVPNNGSRLWTVAGPTSGHARVRIASINNPSHCDISADDFHISNAPLILNIPNGGENWLVGTTQPIRWSYGIFAGKVKIELNRNFPDGPWEMLFSDIPNDGQQPWLVTGPIGNRCRVKVTSMLYPSYTDGSNANFTISPTIALLTPVGGESWRLGTSQAIQWSGGGFDGAVKIELNRFYPGESWETLFASAPDTGSQLWTVSGVTSVDCRVRISSVEHPAIVSTSPANFTICDVPTLLLRSPGGGETWLEGDQQTITWGSQWYDGLIKIEINRDYPGGAWETLFAATDNDGSETWIVSGSPSPRCRMRISSVGQFAVSSLSARDFTIGYSPSLFYEPYNTPLQFEATVGGDNPPPMVLLLSRQGEGSLNWSAVPANSSFPLSVSPSNGSIGPGKSMLEVGVSIQGLEAGAYAWAIAITAPGAVNSPLVIPITVKVNPASVVAPCALLPGWNLISLPLVTDANPQQVFIGLPAGWLIYAWDAANGRYLGGGDVALALGAGYWLKLPGDTPQSCDIAGVPFPEDSLEIPLANGWNIVGPPYAGITAWSAVRILFAGQSYTLEEAIAHSPPLITAAAFYWTGQAYGNARAAGQFESSRGYWIKALTDRCSLAQLGVLRTVGPLWFRLDVLTFSG